MSDYSKKLAFKNKFFNNQTTKKYFIMRGAEVVGTVLKYTTNTYTEIMIYDDDENLIRIEDRNPVKSRAIGSNNEADCFENFYRLYGKNVTDEDLRLLGSGRIALFYANRGLTLID